jgi:hypothetical protein
MGEKKEKLLAPEETKPKCLYANFTDICSKLPGTSTGTILGKKQKLCVSRKSANVRGGMLLIEQSTNQKRARSGDRECGGDVQGAAKKLKVFPIFMQPVIINMNPVFYI